MDDSFVSLEVARALTEVDYPQDQWPQTAYVRRSLSQTKSWDLDYYLSQGRWMLEYLAAPTPLRALNWIEAEKGYQWERYRHPSVDWRWAAYKVPYYGEVCFADDPDALIMLVCQHLKQSTEEKRILST